MDYGSSLMKKEDAEMMNVKEAALAIDWLRAKGLSDTDICNFLTYIATGVGLPTKESDKE